MKSLIRSAVFIISTFFLTSVFAWAGEVTIPNTFNQNTPAVAAEVNDNFSAVEVAVDDNAGDITTNSENIAINATDITTNASDLADHAIETGLHLGVDAVGRSEIADDAVGTSEIQDGVIVNADISTSAAISAGKINDGSGSGLDADTLDGIDSSSFVRDTGDTISGNITIIGDLTVDSVIYNTRRIHHYTVGPTDFVPYGDDPLSNTFGNGGVYVIDGGGYIFAPIHLPHGAAIISFTVYFYDADPTNDLNAFLFAEFLSSGFNFLSSDEVASSGSQGAMSDTDSTISHTVDNTTYSYMVRVDSDAFGTWSSDLRVKGARVSYAIDEAP